ncbi:MAG: dipeptidase [Terriglobales bacterium]
MVSPPAAVERFVTENSDRFLKELIELLRIPSISTLPAHKADMRRAFDFLAAQMRAIGLEHVQALLPPEWPDGNPLLYADWLHAPGAPTVLFYGHYDVQPPDPIAEWTSPPFEPVVRNGNLYARGATDDKGQMFAQLKAVQAWMQSGTKLPVNVKFLIEGEEEVGGAAIDAYVRHNHEALACDCAVVCDTAMYAPGLPSLDVGLRGMVYAEVEVRGAARDLHSGVYGGVAPNPFDALAHVIAGLKDQQGSILIPGFYDRVTAPSEQELEAWKRLPFVEDEYRRHEVGSIELIGEPGYSVLERTWARPTLEVHGMPGGFTGPGSKTVIPARASAKISMRLVPDQRPAEIFEQFVATVKRLVPPAYRCDVQLLHTGDPVVVDTRNRFVEAATAALRATFGAEPVFIRSGGSIPVVSLIGAELKAPVVLMGFGLPDDGLHGPDEKFAVANFSSGIRALARFLGAVAA